MTIKLEVCYTDILHIIVANYWGAQDATHEEPAEEAQFEILSCEMVIDGFLFEGIMSDASIHAVLRESYSNFVECREEGTAPSVAKVLQFPERYNPRKVQAANRFIETLKF